MRPKRERVTHNQQTYFVTSLTWQRRPLFQVVRWAELFLEVLDSYGAKAYLLHEYVLMPEHFHLLITPSVSLEKAMQLIKGGFSFRAKKELGSAMEIWQVGFSDHRIRDVQDYRKHLEYIRRNPVGRGLAQKTEDYPYCSDFPGRIKDEVPQWLKPLNEVSDCGAAEAAPFQNNPRREIEAKAAPLQNEAGLKEQAESLSKWRDGDDNVSPIPKSAKAGKC